MELSASASDQYRWHGGFRTRRIGHPIIRRSAWICSAYRLCIAAKSD